VLEVTGTTVMTPRPSRPAVSLAASLLTMTAGGPWRLRSRGRVKRGGIQRLRRQLERHASAAAVGTVYAPASSVNMLGGYAAVGHSCTNVLAGSFLIIRPSVRSAGIKPHWRESPLRIPSPSSTSIPGGTTTVPAVTGSTESGTASPGTAATRLIARWPSGS
jgi:hypothetical protein